MKDAMSRIFRRPTGFGAALAPELAPGLALPLPLPLPLALALALALKAFFFGFVLPSECTMRCHSPRRTPVRDRAWCGWCACGCWWRL